MIIPKGGNGIMGRQYKKPPVTEVVCEFFLPADFQWDMTLPGLVYQVLKSEYPIKERRLVQEVAPIPQVQAQALSGTQPQALPQAPNIIQHKLSVSERLWLYTEDRKNLVQIGPNVLAVNRIMPYPGWDVFSPRVYDVFSNYAKAVNLEKLQKVGLKFINNFEIPVPLEELATYVDYMPYLGAGIPRGITSFFLGGIVNVPQSSDSIKIELTTTITANEGNSAFMMLIDYVNVNQDLLSLGQVVSKIEEAHKHVEDMFEKCIKDPLRQIFEEANV